MSESSYGAAQGPRSPVPPYVPPTAQDGRVWSSGPPSAPTQQIPGGMGGAGALPRPPAPESASVPSPQPSRASMRAAAPRLGMSQQLRDGDLALDIALTRMVESGASDLHLTAGAPPMIRLNGTLAPLEGFAVLTGDVLQRSLYAVLTQKQRETFEVELELDFAYAVRGCARFRVNLYQQRESIGAAFRVIPYEIKPLEELGVPAVVGSFAGLPRGLVLVTGPTGSGKSTTLAAIVDLANRTRSDHIMTVEDPIEFLHRHKRSLINQREVGADTHSFASALKHVLRQDPDIILVGEMRDLETISVALTAAETGHLVLATLHTQDAAQTIDRVIDVFPSHQQDQVRTQLAGAIQGVVCQTLCKKSVGKGRVVATEVLVATPAIRNLIREGKTHQIYSAMQAGAQQGMHTMDQQLAELVRANKISYEVGLEKCHHVEDFNRLAGRSTRMNQGASALQSTGSGMTPDGMGGF
ncbi:PilT/PilU family type 4a pilus ATPase [Cellulomonas hominis]